jgi:hypothetical protein
MSFPFSITFFGHQLAAALLLIGFFLIYRLNVNPGPPEVGFLFLIGLVLGFALITEYPTVVIVLLLVFYYFYILWRKRALRQVLPLLLPALGGLIPLGLMLAYNTSAYGHPFVVGYQYLDDLGFKQAMSQGIMGIGLPRLDVLFYETLHPAQGLFWQSPVLLMALVGGFFMFRTRKYLAEGLVVAFAFFAYLLLNSGYYMWWGGASFGPRHLTPMLPFLSLPLIFVPRRLFPLVIILAIISIFQMTIVVASDVMTSDVYYVKISQIGLFEFSAIYSDCLKHLVNGDFAWNLGQALFELKTWASLLPIALVVTGATFFMAFYPTRLDRNRRSQLGQSSSSGSGSKIDP